MADNTQTQTVRLQNLRSLHARPGGAGAPTSDFLVQFLNDKGVGITKNELSDIYWKKRPISDFIASGIEKAFLLPIGWLSEDHEFLFGLNPDEIGALRSLAALPGEVKLGLYSLVAALSPYIAKEPLL